MLGLPVRARTSRAGVQAERSSHAAFASAQERFQPWRQVQAQGLRERVAKVVLLSAWGSGACGALGPLTASGRRYAEPPGPGGQADGLWAQGRGFDSWCRALASEERSEPFLLRRSTSTQACACATLPSAGGHRAAGSAVAGGSGCDDVRPTSPAGIFKRSRSLRVRFYATGVTGGRQSGRRPSPCGSTNQAGSGAWLFGCARQHVAPGGLSCTGAWCRGPRRASASVSVSWAWLLGTA